jgi:hypothetical protein
MGAWGVLAFDNDGACDWAYELEAVDDLSLVNSTFDAVAGENEYLDAHEASNALAACEVIARLRGNHGYSNAHTKDVDTWVATHRIDPPASILARAEAVIERVLGDRSELRDLWDQSEAIGLEWRRSVEDLRRRLRV